MKKYYELCYSDEVEERIHGFPPVVGKDPRILIIGSMPSVRSLERGQYYGHPRNHFWQLIYTIIGKPLPQDYGARVEGLRTSGIALWDAIGECRREGSLDQAIRDESFNDVGRLILEHPTIRLVVFNGTKAENTFWKGIGFWHNAAAEPAAVNRSGGLHGKGLFLKKTEERCRYMRLPSTSPVPTRIYRRLEDKLEAWSVLSCYIDGETE